MGEKERLRLTSCLVLIPNLLRDEGIITLSPFQQVLVGLTREEGGGHAGEDGQQEVLYTAGTHPFANLK